MNNLRPRKEITPYRSFLFDLRDALRIREFKMLKEFFHAGIPDERWRVIPTSDGAEARNELFLALQENNLIGPTDMKLLAANLNRIGRRDLAGKAEEVQEIMANEIQGHGQVCKKKVALISLGVIGLSILLCGYQAFIPCTTYQLVKYRLGYKNPDITVCFPAAVKKTGNAATTTRTKEELGTEDEEAFSGWLPSWKVIVVSTLVVLTAVMTFQVVFPCSMLRMWRCRLGSIPGHVMSFRFVTLDMQDAYVRGIEFEWETLKAKLGLKADGHQDQGMHYYLNYDRCGNGGVRTVRSWLDGLPQIRGAEVLAVNEEGTEVYYNHKAGWHRYKSAEEIRCSHHGINRLTQWDPPS